MPASFDSFSLLKSKLSIDIEFLFLNIRGKSVGEDIDVGCDTICVHSDTPNAVEIIKGIKSAINQ